MFRLIFGPSRPSHVRYKNCSQVGLRGGFLLLLFERKAITIDLTLTELYKTNGESVASNVAENSNCFGAYVHLSFGLSCQFITYTPYRFFETRDDLMAGEIEQYKD